MGIILIAKMNKTLALLLVATLVGIYAVTEIQELGNANADAVKSSDVATSDDAEDDDLGEDVGRRGGAFLSTTGSFTLSSGSNTAGNDESLELSEGLGERGGTRAFKAKKEKLKLADCGGKAPAACLLSNSLKGGPHKDWLVRQETDLCMRLRDGKVLCMLSSFKKQLWEKMKKGEMKSSRFRMLPFKLGLLADSSAQKLFPDLASHMVTAAKPHPDGNKVVKEQMAAPFVTMKRGWHFTFNWSRQKRATEPAQLWTSTVTVAKLTPCVQLRIGRKVGKRLELPTAKCEVLKTFQVLKSCP